MRIDFSRTVLILAPFAAVVMIYSSSSRPRASSPYANYHPPSGTENRFGPGPGGFPTGQFPFTQPPWQITLASLPLEVMSRVFSLAPQQRADIGKVLEAMQMQTRMGGLQLMRANEEAGKRIETLLTPVQWDQVPKVLRDAETFRAIGLPLEAMEKLSLTANQRMKLAELAHSRPFPHFNAGTAHPIDPAVLDLLTTEQRTELASSLHQ